MSWVIKKKESIRSLHTAMHIFVHINCDRNTHKLHAHRISETYRAHKFLLYFIEILWGTYVQSLLIFFLLNKHEKYHVAYCPKYSLEVLCKNAMSQVSIKKNIRHSTHLPPKNVDLLM